MLSKSQFSNNTGYNGGNGGNIVPSLKTTMPTYS